MTNTTLKGKPDAGNPHVRFVKKFVDEGSRVFTCACNAKSAADGNKLLAEMGVKGYTRLLCDISDRAQVDAMMDRIAHEAGRLDILVNTVRRGVQLSTHAGGRRPVKPVNGETNE